MRTAKRRSWVRWLAAMALCTTGLAQEPEAQPHRRWFQWEHASGDWGGVRSELDGRGLHVEPGFTAVWQANHRGGIRSKPEGKYTASWDIVFDFDTGRAGLWPGGELFLYVEGSSGKGIDGPYGTSRPSARTSLRSRSGRSTRRATSTPMPLPTTSAPSSSTRRW